jgi:hypothetical protein
MSVADGRFRAAAPHRPRPLRQALGEIPLACHPPGSSARGEEEHGAHNNSLSFAALPFSENKMHHHGVTHN